MPPLLYMYLLLLIHIKYHHGGAANLITRHKYQHTWRESLVPLTSMTSFMTGVHLDRLYVSAWERSRLLGLRENRLGCEQQRAEQWAGLQCKSETPAGTARHTNRGDDRRPEVLPVQDELALVFDLHVLDKFAQVLLRRPWLRKLHSRGEKSRWCLERFGPHSLNIWSLI